MKIETKPLLIFAFIVLILGAFAFHWIWLPVSGQVLDAETGEPIEGAIVVATWHGRVPVPPAESYGTCYHVESTTTDSDGRFSFPMSFDGRVWMVNKVRAFEVYKAGYRDAKKTYATDEQGNSREAYYLVSDAGTVEGRIEFLRMRSLQCGVTLSLAKAMYYEANSLLEGNVVLSSTAKLQLEMLAREVAQRAVDPEFQLSPDKREFLMKKYIQEQLQ